MITVIRTATAFVWEKSSKSFRATMAAIRGTRFASPTSWRSDKSGLASDAPAPLQRITRDRTRSAVPKKAMECWRNALTATNPAVRMMYLHIAKQWNEMAEYAKRRSNGTGREREQGVVVFPNRFSKIQVKA